MALNTQAQNPNTYDVVPAKTDISSSRGSCSWFERPISGNQKGDELYIVDMGNILFVWDGLNWINPSAMFSADITGTYTIDRGDLEQCKNATGAVAITIPNDTVLELTTQPNYRACIAVYQVGAGAPTFIAGAGVNAFAGTQKTAATGVMHGLARVGANTWAYL